MKIITAETPAKHYISEVYIVNQVDISKSIIRKMLFLWKILLEMYKLHFLMTELVTGA